MVPSMVPGLKPAALSLPCRSRISSGVNDTAPSGVGLSNCCGTGGEETGGEATDADETAAGGSAFRRTSSSLVASASGRPRASAYSRTALRVWRPMAPSMAPGLKPAALSLPCRSRISSGVNGTALACAVDGICDVDGGSSGVDLASSFATSEETDADETAAGGSAFRRTSNSLVASAFGRARASAYSRTALRVWRPMVPSMAPGLKPAALSLPCSSRISSVVNGAGLGRAVDGICDADGGNSRVPLAESCRAGGEATGGGEAAGAETRGDEAVRGAAGGAETSGAAAGGAETGGGAFASSLPVEETSAFACSIRLDDNGFEG